jgi:hypothetical protein
LNILTSANGAGVIYAGSFINTLRIVVHFIMDIVSFVAHRALCLIAGSTVGHEVIAAAALLRRRIHIFIVHASVRILHARPHHDFQIRVSNDLWGLPPSDTAVVAENIFIQLRIDRDKALVSNHVLGVDRLAGHLI